MKETKKEEKKKEEKKETKKETKKEENRGSVSTQTRLAWLTWCLGMSWTPSGDGRTG